MQGVTHARAPRDTRSRLGRSVRRAFFGTILILVLIVSGTAFRVWQVARFDDRRQVDMAVVLGAAQYNGTPSAVLEARLKQALELYQQGLAEHIVTVGGRQSGDNYTEAQAGEKWLIENGVPDSRIEEVDVGSDTLGSVRAVSALAHRKTWDTALIVSDPWHSLRARTMANDLGLETWTSPTRSGPTVETRAIQARQIFRETGGLLYYRLTHAPAEAIGLG